MESRGFSGAKAFRAWLARNHATARELIVCCARAGEKGLGYKEALDEALCFGWIDGVRRSIDDRSFSVRFTPRQERSAWSRVNVRRYRELLAEGRVTEAGQQAFTRGIPSAYSFESRPQALAPAFLARLQADAEAWSHWQAEPPWYRRTCTHWVMSAKQEETRARRFEHLLRCARAGCRIGPLDRKG